MPDRNILLNIALAPRKQKNDVWFSTTTGYSRDRVKPFRIGPNRNDLRPKEHMDLSLESSSCERQQEDTEGNADRSRNRGAFAADIFF